MPYNEEDKRNAAAVLTGTADVGVRAAPPRNALSDFTARGNTGAKSRREAEFGERDTKLARLFRRLACGTARRGGPCVFCAADDCGMSTRFPLFQEDPALCRECVRSLDRLAEWVKGLLESPAATRSNSRRMRRYHLLLAALKRLSDINPKTFTDAFELAKAVELFQQSVAVQNRRIARAVRICASPDLWKEIGAREDAVEFIADGMDPLARYR